MINTLGSLGIGLRVLSGNTVTGGNGVRRS